MGDNLSDIAYRFSKSIAKIYDSNPAFNRVDPSLRIWRSIQLPTAELRDISVEKDMLTTLITELSEMDANAIANFLTREGIHGTPSDTWKCPLAAYLGMHIKYPVAVDTDAIWLMYYQDDGVETPETLQEFIANFDDGEYPELEWADGENGNGHTESIRPYDSDGDS